MAGPGHATAKQVAGRPVLEISELLIFGFYGYFLQLTVLASACTLRVHTACLPARSGSQGTGLPACIRFQK